LEGILGEECRLHRVKSGTVGTEALDRGDRAAFDLCRKGEAGENTLAIDMDGAGAALALVASLLRAGEAQMLAQRIEERDARLDFDFMSLAIDFKL
jgi:hypothetical protein